MSAVIGGGACPDEWAGPTFHPAIHEDRVLKLLSFSFFFFLVEWLAGTLACWFGSEQDLSWRDYRDRSVMLQISNSLIYSLSFLLLFSYYSQVVEIVFLQMHFLKPNSIWC